MTSLLEPHYSCAALLTIDVQRDTLDGQPLEVSSTSAKLPRIRAMANAFRRVAPSSTWCGSTVPTATALNPSDATSSPARRSFWTLARMCSAPSVRDERTK
jgi:hypothetical protein